jgi:hypothetical protein
MLPHARSTAKPGKARPTRRAPFVADIWTSESLRPSWMLISGKCHCGNISFTLDWQPEPSEIPARACTCSFCVKHGGVWTSCPTGALKVSVKDPSLVSKYSFGTKTADFHVCSACGVTPVVTSHIDDRLYAVVSVNAFEGVDPSLLREASHATFDQESEEVRLARRKRNWIANVEFESVLAKAPSPTSADARA